MMIRIIKELNKGLVLGVISFMFLCSGCASPGGIYSRGRFIAKGESLEADLTCRVNNREVIFTTRRDIAEDPNTEKAFVFIPMKKYKPLILRAGNESRKPKEGKLVPFETELKYRLAQVLVGKEKGKQLKLVLTSGPLDGLTSRDRYLRVSLSTRHPKDVVVNRRLFTEQQKKEPVIGEKIIYGPFSAEVTGVSADQVRLRIFVKDGARVKGSFSRGILRDRNRFYEIVEDVKAGQLVRVGPLIGQVIKVDKKMFTMDFADPFGGKRIFCDVIARDKRPER